MAVFVKPAGLPKFVTIAALGELKVFVGKWLWCSRREEVAFCTCCSAALRHII